MAQKKEDSGFTITDRRLFTPEGELRSEIPEDAPPKPVSEPAPGKQTATAPDPNMPPTPSAAEQKAQADAYRKSSKDLDARVELSGHSAKELEMTFERFLASLYMSAMMQLGLMHEEGEAHGAGQWHIHGCAHHWLHLCRVPIIRSSRLPHATLGPHRVRRQVCPYRHHSGLP